MINYNKISNFVNNIEFLSHSNYESILGKIFSEFKGDEWLSRVIVSFMLYEKFNKEYEVFIEATKDSLNAHRPFPEISHNELIDIIDQVIPYFDSNPKLFEYIVPIHPYSLISLYKAKGTTHIFDYYLEQLKERPEYLTEELLKYNLYPEQLYGVINFTDEDSFNLTLNSSFYNSVFYRFGFEKLDRRQDFLPKMAFYSNERLKQEMNYNLSDDKDFLYDPKLKSIKGKMLPVVVSIKNGMVWYSLHLREKHNLDIPVDIDLKEALEGAVLLDALSIFKMINLKESFKDAESIALLIKNKKNKTLLEIFKDYYEEKYEDQNEVSINGSEIYKSFINSDDFVIEKEEVEEFNRLISEYNIEPDKVNFLLFYKRLKDEVPIIVKPVVSIKKLINKIYPEKKKE